MNKAMNWVMLLSLITVFVTGILLKPMPNMWLGILHGVSGLLLFVTAMIHIIKQLKLKKK